MTVSQVPTGLKKKSCKRDNVVKLALFEAISFEKSSQKMRPYISTVCVHKFISFCDPYFDFLN